MENKLKLNMKNMKIVHYEVGNLAKMSAARPVCAIMFQDIRTGCKCKALFKDDKAFAIHKYIHERKTLGKISNESANVIGYFRELRKDCIVVDNIEQISFNVSVDI